MQTKFAAYSKNKGGPKSRKPPRLDKNKVRSNYQNISDYKEEVLSHRSFKSMQPRDPEATDAKKKALGPEAMKANKDYYAVRTLGHGSAKNSEKSINN